MARLFVTGRSNYYQLGLNQTSNQTSWVQIGSDTDWDHICIGLYASLAVKGGKLYYTGRNDYNRVAPGSTAAVTAWTQIGTDTDWEKVQTAENTSFAIKGGQLWGIGGNTIYELGIGDNTNRTSWTLINSDTDWEDICIGAYAACSLGIKGGRLWGTGPYDHSKYTGIFGPRNSWGLVNSDTDWEMVCVGFMNATAIKGGKLFVAGENGNYYALGTGTTAHVAEWTQIGTYTDWERVGSSTSSEGFGAIRAGRLYVAGRNSYGELCINTYGASIESWTQVGSDADWQDFSVNGLFSLAKKGNKLYFSGSNAYGQAGIASPTSGLLLYEISSITDPVGLISSPNASTGLLLVEPEETDLDLSGDYNAYYQSLGGVSGEVLFDFNIAGWAKHDISFPLLATRNAIKNLSGEYAAFYQKFVEFCFDLEVVPPAFEFFQFLLEAGSWELDTFSMPSAAFYQELNDISSFLETYATKYNDFGIENLAGKNSLNKKFMLLMQAVRQIKRNVNLPLSALLENASTEVGFSIEAHRGSFKFLQSLFEVTDKNIRRDLGMSLLAIKKAPKFQYYYFQNTASAVVAVSGE